MGLRPFGRRFYYGQLLIWIIHYGYYCQCNAYWHLWAVELEFT